MAFILKPIGTKESNIALAPWTGKISFSRKSRPDIKPGNILIPFAVGYRKIMTHVKVESEVLDEQPPLTEEMERWPYYVRWSDMSPVYHSKWWTLDNTIDSLRDEYLTIKPDGKITAAGGMTFGTFSFRNDRVELDFHFACYIINKLKEVVQ